MNTFTQDVLLYNLELSWVNSVTERSLVHTKVFSPLNTGVMNAADYYGLEELKRACFGFVQCCVTVDTVCALLATAERYIQYKCTKYLVQKVRYYFFCLSD